MFVTLCIFITIFLLKLPLIFLSSLYVTHSLSVFIILDCRLNCASQYEEAMMRFVTALDLEPRDKNQVKSYIDKLQHADFNDDDDAAPINQLII